MWSNLASNNGQDSGKMNRDIIATEMTPQQIAKARRLAREWKPSRQRSESKNWNIMLLQRNLADLGYDPGPIDGFVGTVARGPGTRHRL